jgi:glycosyltransferase involved in cell wall biosynthesis
MNVMEIVSGVEVDGVVVHCLLLMRELTRRGHGVTLVCRPRAWIRTQLGNESIEVVESDLARRPGELRRMTDLARARRVDVVHTHMSRAHFFGVLLRWWGGLPCVATAHSQRFQLHWRFNDAVIANSDSTRRYHQRRNFVPAGRIETIHCFVDLARISAGAAARDATRTQLGVAADAPLVGTIGTVIPRKGVDHLVRAWARVVADIPGARLLVVGDEPGAYAADLRRMAGTLGIGDSIIWAGRRLDIPEVLAALELFVLASVEEPFGLVLGEAMAAGLPVVATAVGGVPECVVAGETGLLVAAADPPALAAAIIALLRDPAQRRRFGAAGRRRVGERFIADTQVPRIEAVLARAAARSTRQG